MLKNNLGKAMDSESKDTDEPKKKIKCLQELLCRLRELDSNIAYLECENAPTKNTREP